MQPDQSKATVPTDLVQVFSILKQWKAELKKANVIVVPTGRFRTKKSLIDRK